MKIGPYAITMREAQGEYNGPFSTYPEVHAFTWAVGYMATLVMALYVNDIAAAAVLAQIVRVSYFAMTGNRLDIAGRTPGILPDRYLRQIRSEAHYWFGGLVIGAGVAGGLDELGYIEFVRELQDLAPADVIDRFQV